MAEREIALHPEVPNTVTEKALALRPKETMWSRNQVLSGIRLLCLTIIMIGVALLITMYFFPLVGITDSLLLFFPAIAFISWYLGPRAGLGSILLATLAIYFFLLPPQFSSIHSLAEMLKLGLFILSTLGIVYLIERNRYAKQVEKYLLREKEYQELILKLHKDYLTAKEEILARDEFLSIASHELKTPLSTMLLQLQSVLHNIRNVSLANFSVEHLLKMLDSAEQQSKRLSKMINDLLNVSLITTGRMDLEKEEMNLTETVKEAVERIFEKTKKDGQEVTFLAKDIIHGVFDKLRIEQAISNLLTNAIKYGDKNPIIVTVKKQGGMAEVIVKDHGIGIPEGKQKKIFARFERAVAKQSFEGLGVGLYITHQIVTAHGGKITVDSKEGKGSTFTLCLPLEVSSK